MTKELPKSSWVDFLQSFAENHQSQMVKLYAEDSFEGKRLLGEHPLIAFEGDCTGEIVNGVKIVIGEEGEKPNNLFHFVQTPQKIEIDEDGNGVVERARLVDSDGVITTLELE